MAAISATAAGALPGLRKKRRVFEAFQRVAFDQGAVDSEHRMIGVHRQVDPEVRVEEERRIEKALTVFGNGRVRLAVRASSAPAH